MLNPREIKQPELNFNLWDKRLINWIILKNISSDESSIVISYKYTNI